MRKSLPYFLPLDQIWNEISEFFQQKPLGRPRIHAPYTILKAIFYIAKTGCQWAELPPNHPPYKTVHHYFRKWTQDGIWEIICRKIRKIIRIKSDRNPRSTGISIDSQSVKTFYGSGAVGYDGHKKVKGRKRHLMTDSLGLLIFVICLRANIHDIKGGRMLINRLRKDPDLCDVLYINADQAYISLDTKEHKAKVKISSIPKGTGFKPVPQRWKIERSISWLRGYRRLNMDYEKKTRYSEAWVYISFIQIMAKKLEKLGKLLG
ncbi:MAG: IS5 family transposase [Pseudomonadota bacterium]